MQKKNLKNLKRKCHIAGLIAYVVFSDWAASWVTCIQIPSMSLHGSIAHSMSALKTVSSSGGATVYLSITSWGHLDCFQVLAVFNKASIDIMQRPLCGLESPALWDQYQGLWLLVCVVTVGFVLWKASKLSLSKGCAVSVPTNSGSEVVLLHVVTSKWCFPRSFQIVAILTGPLW